MAQLVHEHPEVEAALRDGKPVVALESAVITAGLPKEPHELTAELGWSDWDDSQAVNLELARCAEQTVRSHSAIPATIAMIDGTLHVGVTSEQLERLATDPAAGKVSLSNLASASAQGMTAGTTVAATLEASFLTEYGNIRTFATGGIGGVHRNWTHLPDISADLRAIGRTSDMCIVCAGAKSLLDIPATLEALESLGVPVVGFQSRYFPQFYERGTHELACVVD
ncbi:MAG: pseudouridine-5'-phosphate glycosidase, partial [Planctomycetota bacterium]